MRRLAPVAALGVLFASSSPALAEPVAQRGIAPFRGPGSQAPARSLPEVTGSLKYYGGRVISNVQVVAVFWGPNVNAEVTSKIGGFYQAIVASPFIDWLLEYDTTGHTPGTSQTIGRGSFAGSFTITPSLGTTTLTDANIQSELAAQIQAGHLPAPTTDAAGNVNTVYMIAFPPSVSISNAGANSCVSGGFCAYHGTGTVGGKNLYYGVQMDVATGPCASGCGTNSLAFDNATAFHSHELVEAITDAEIGLTMTVGAPMAWYDSVHGEIGDICATGTSAEYATVDGYVVQTEWSNSLNACIATNPAVMPPVDAGAPEGGVADGGADAGTHDAGFADATAPDASLLDASTPDAGGADAGATDASTQEAGPGGDGGPGGQSDASGGGDGSAAGSSSGEGGGCAVSSGRTGASGWFASLLLGVLGLAGARRRNRNG